VRIERDSAFERGREYVFEKKRERESLRGIVLIESLCLREIGCPPFPLHLQRRQPYTYIHTYIYIYIYIYIYQFSPFSTCDADSPFKIWIVLACAAPRGLLYIYIKSLYLSYTCTYYNSISKDCTDIIYIYIISILKCQKSTCYQIHQ
jgi:hypothetical protein